MKNKRAMSIPIVLLVILTLVLITVSLFYFVIKEKGIEETMLVIGVIDSVYIEEAQLNYYLKEIFDSYPDTKKSLRRFIEPIGSRRSSPTCPAPRYCISPMTGIPVLTP